MFEKIVSWKVLRSFGELQILTKASYLAIVLIPIIAGLWPSVRVAINHYNEIAIAATNQLDSASASLQEKIDKLSYLDNIKVDGTKEIALEVKIALAGIGEAANKLEERVEVFRQKFDPRQLDIPTLPMVWVFAFIGSVFVIVGHLIYQSSVPETIKQNSKIQHVLVMRKLGVESGSGHKYDINNMEIQAADEYERASLSGSILVKVGVLTFYVLGLICILLVVGFQIAAVLNAAGVL